MSRIWIFFVLICTLGAMYGTAYGQSDTCPALVDQAITVANQNCESLGRNQACYGYQTISAAFYEPVDAETFNEPTDIVDLTALRQIITLPANPETGEVGVAIMKLQAMLPNTLPGQNVVFVMLGDVELESALAQDEIVAPADPITVMTTAATNVHSGPDATFNVVSNLQAGASLSADGLDDSGDWVRVVIDQYPVWVARTALEAPATLASLPALEGQNYGAMQAFTLSTGVGTTRCAEAPGTLLIQGPKTSEIRLNINGADISIASTVAFQATRNNRLRVSVLDGRARLTDSQVILGGFTAAIELDPESGQITGDWLDTEPLEAGLLDTLQELEALEGELLNYAFEVPELATIEELIDLGALELQNDFDNFESYDIDLAALEALGFENFEADLEL
ncbi:MAG: hypothetical protein ACOYL5_20695, partial [Phototrophicaceae bacterium]